MVYIWIYICICMYIFIYVDMHMCLHVYGYIYMIARFKERESGTSSHGKRREPKWSQGLAHRTHGQPLQGTAVRMNMFQFWTCHSDEDTVFWGREPHWPSWVRGRPLSQGGLGTLKNSSVPAVSIEAGWLTKGEMEILLLEEAGMHAGLSGDTDANKDRLSRNTPVHPHVISSNPTSPFVRYHQLGPGHLLMCTPAFTS